MAPMMQAITIRGGKGGADALQVEDVPVPALRPGHVLVRVRAAGVNRPDLLQRAGLYPPPPGASDILGLEVAGEVAELAEEQLAGSPVACLGSDARTLQRRLQQLLRGHLDT